MDSNTIVVSNRINGPTGILNLIIKNHLNASRIPILMYEFLTEFGIVNRLFTYFNTYYDFFESYYNIPEKDRCFHEVILGNIFQKIRFDIDIPEDKSKTYEEICILSDNILEILIDHIIKNFKLTFNIDLILERNICLYESHHDGSLEKMKRSYHVIIDNYCMESSEQIKQFCLNIINSLPVDISSSGMIDSGIYKNLQNFRIALSHKSDSIRIKTPIDIWYYHGKLIRHLYYEGNKLVSILQESFITFCSYCKILPYGDQILPKRYITINDQDVEGLEKVFKTLQEKFNNDFPYKYSGIVNGFHNFTRTKSAICPLCNRRHDCENAYMIYTGNSYIFKCRRNQKDEIIIDLIEEKLDKIIEHKDKNISKEKAPSRFEILNKIGDDKITDDIYVDVKKEQIFDIIFSKLRNKNLPE